MTIYTNVLTTKKKKLFFIVKEKFLWGCRMIYYRGALLSAYVTYTLFQPPLKRKKGLCDDIHLFARVFPFRRRGEILGGLDELSNRGEQQKE